MSEQPTVSVVIPCYNAVPYLSETINSVLNQRYRPIEILVVDDGSTDDSAAIAESYGAPVRVIRQANQGESAARNRGMDEAKGEWIAFLDADDIWERSKLEKQVELISDEVVAVHTNLYFFGAINGEMNTATVPPEKRYSLEYIAQASPLNTTTLMVRSSCAPRFPVWTKYAEDLVFQLEVAQRGRVVLVPELLCGYRRHQTNQSNRKAIDVEWHKTILRWLGDPANSVDNEVRARIHDGWICRIVRLAWAARERRDWGAYWAYREHIAQFAGHPEVERLLANRIYPRFAYSMLDGYLAFKNRLMGRQIETAETGAMVQG